jgi:hypothetical protein
VEEAAKWRPFFHSGGRSPGDLSHSVMWEPVLACRALRIISSLTAPGGSSLASSRRCFASCNTGFPL